MVRRGRGTARGSLRRGRNGKPGHASAQHCPLQHYALHLAVLLTTTITM